MDAEARTGSQVLACIGLRGARYGDLRKATGLAPEALDAALKALRASRLIVSENHRWWQCGNQPSLTAPAIPRSQRLSLKDFRAKRSREAQKRWARVLLMDAEGAQRDEIAESLGITRSSVKRLLDRAREWDARGRP